MSGLRNLVEVIHHCAVQAPEDFVAAGAFGWIHVLRDRSSIPFSNSDELVVCQLDSRNSRLRSQVETVPKFDHSAYDRGMVEVQPGFDCPLIGTDYIVFPEVTPGAKPVVVLCAGLKLRTAQKLLGGFETASVICKD